MHHADASAALYISIHQLIDPATNPFRPERTHGGGERLTGMESRAGRKYTDGVVPAGVHHPDNSIRFQEERMAHEEHPAYAVAAPRELTGARGRARPATDGDLDRILEIDALCFEKPWDDTAFREAIKDLFIVYEEESVTGFLAACCREAARDATIMKVAVHPDHRGKGIASRLLEAVLDKLRELRIRAVDLDVEVVNAGAIGLYERFGFRVVTAVPANSDEDEEYCIMRLPLDEPGCKAS
jgi:[ribosomal protein S18]-alanine N-acetyltransferase